MKLTIALQRGMQAEINQDGNIEIDIPDTCKKDLWDAQLEYWLEKDMPTYKNAKIDGGFLRIIKNKIKFINHNY